MAEEAGSGLMLWDGESRGTLLNILRLIARSRPVVVYVATARRFETVRAQRDFDTLILALAPAAARRLHRQAAGEGLALRT